MSEPLDVEYIAPEDAETEETSHVIIVTGFATFSKYGTLWPVRCDDCGFDFAVTVDPKTEDFQYCLRCRVQFFDVDDEFNVTEDESEEDSENGAA